MGIKANFNIRDIERDLAGFTDGIVNAAVQALGFLGAKCVNYARTIPDRESGGNGFKDQTGNLRSSIGFKVFVNGQPVKEDYKLVLNGKEGIENGKALADRVGSQYTGNSIILVVTAGMEYAVHVESTGRDVISTSELMAEREWPEMKRKIDEMMRRQMK